MARAKVRSKARQAAAMREERRRKVADLYRRKYTQDEIAAMLTKESQRNGGDGVSQSTVSRDIALLEDRWRAAAAKSIDDLKSRELAELVDMERACARQFASTKDPRWVEARLRIKGRIARMMALDGAASSVSRVELAGPGGGPVEVATRELSDAERAVRLAAFLERTGTGGN